MTLPFNPDRYRVTAPKRRERPKWENRDLPRHGRVNFWCVRCAHDFPNLTATRYGRVGKEHWRARCPGCDGEVTRLIDEPSKDLYWDRSRFVAEQRKKYAGEVLQPNDYGYKTRYGNIDATAEQEIIEAEIEAWEERKSVEGPSRSIIPV